MNIKYVTGCYSDKFHSILKKSYKNENDLHMLAWGLSSLDIYRLLRRGNIAGVLHKIYCDLDSAKDALEADRWNGRGDSLQTASYEGNIYFLTHFMGYLYYWTRRSSAR